MGWRREMGMEPLWCEHHEIEGEGLEQDGERNELTLGIVSVRMGLFH